MDMKEAFHVESLLASLKSSPKIKPSPKFSYDFDSVRQEHRFCLDAETTDGRSFYVMERLPVINLRLEGSAALAEARTRLLRGWQQAVECIEAGVPIGWVTSLTLPAPEPDKLAEGVVALAGRVLDEPCPPDEYKPELWNMDDLPEPDVQGEVRDGH
jgi:hypothetical protein